MVVAEAMVVVQAMVAVAEEHRPRRPHTNPPVVRHRLKKGRRVNVAIRRSV